MAQLVWSHPSRKQYLPASPGITAGAEEPFPLPRWAPARRKMGVCCPQLPKWGEARRQVAARCLLNVRHGWQQDGGGGGDDPGLEQRFAFGPPASEKIAAIMGLLNVFERS